MPKDLGTYHFKCWFSNGKSYIMSVNTGSRYTHGSGMNHPIDAARIPPTWESEEELVSGILFGLTENGCDCNKTLDWMRSQQIEIADDFDPSCGDEWQLERAVMVRPDGSEVEVYISACTTPQ